MSPAVRAIVLFVAAAGIALGAAHAQRQALISEVRAHRDRLDAEAGEGGHAPAEIAAQRKLAVLAGSVRRLAASPRAEDRTKLRAMLEDSASEAFAIQAIADRPVPEDEDALRARVNRDSMAIALQARRGLLQLGKVDEAYPALVALGRSGIPALEAFQVGVERKTPTYHPRALDYCLAVTTTASRQVVLEACDGLIALGRAEVAHGVLARMLGSKDSQERYDAATTAAAHVSRPEFRALLEGHRDDPDYFVKEAVAEALATTATARPR